MKLDVARNYSVMYKGIPKETFRKRTPLDLFSKYFPNEVVDAQVGVHAHGLRRLVKKWEKISEKLHFARAALEEKGTHTTVRYCCYLSIFLKFASFPILNLMYFNVLICVQDKTNLWKKSGRDCLVRTRIIRNWCQNRH